MKDELIVRRWTPEDQEAVIDLHVLGLRSTNAYAGRGPWDADLEDVENAYLLNGGEFLVGLVSGRLVAMGALRIEADKGEIRRMRVHPEFQRRGFGQKILSMLEGHAAELGCKVILLDTSLVQTAAQALYRKNGYVEVGRKTAGGPFELMLFEKRLTRTISAADEDSSVS